MITKGLGLGKRDLFGVILRHPVKALLLLCLGWMLAPFVSALVLLAVLKIAESADLLSIASDSSVDFMTMLGATGDLFGVLTALLGAITLFTVFGTFLIERGKGEEELRLVRTMTEGNSEILRDVGEALAADRKLLGSIAEANAEQARVLKESGEATRKLLGSMDSIARSVEDAASRLHETVKEAAHVQTSRHKSEQELLVDRKELIESEIRLAKRRVEAVQGQTRMMQSLAESNKEQADAMRIESQRNMVSQHTQLFRSQVHERLAAFYSRLRDGNRTGEEVWRNRTNYLLNKLRTNAMPEGFGAADETRRREQIRDAVRQMRGEGWDIKINSYLQTLTQLMDWAGMYTADPDRDLVVRLYRYLWDTLFAHDIALLFYLHVAGVEGPAGYEAGRRKLLSYIRVDEVSRHLASQNDIELVRDGDWYQACQSGG